MRSTSALLALCLALGAAACSDDDVASEEEARQAYFGLDKAIGLAMDLGFDGFNSASSANIAPQTGTGEVRGTITITGQVDQGSSDNKGMRLQVELVDYVDQPADDDPEIAYDTPGTKPALTLSLKKIPTGTLEGSLAGTFSMSGGLEGDVTLALSMNGTLEPDPADASKVRRKPGTTRVTGTATSRYGTYDVDLTR